MLTLDPTYHAALDRQWDQLGRPGARLTSRERISLAAAARAARRGETPDLDIHPAMLEAARTFAADPAAPRADWVASLAQRGVDAASYVEILSLVARLSAIDTLLFGLGQPERPLPDVQPGAPTGAIDPTARIDGGFAPTVGAAFPTTALTMLTGEQDTMFDLHGALYLSIEEMADLGVVKDLDRRQMELVAARTSLLNDCFF